MADEIHIDWEDAQEEHFERDLVVEDKYFDDIRDEDKSQPHLSWPSLNVIAASFAEALTQEIVQAAQNGEVDVEQIAANAASAFYVHALAIHNMACDGYKLLSVPCTADHSEDKD